MLGAHMTRIGVRAGKTPFEVLSPNAVFAANRVGSNSGNFIFSNAAWKTLWHPDSEIGRCKLVASEADVGEINERFDMLVLPFANAFRLSFRDNLAQWTRVIRKLKIPVVVLGIGAQSNTSYDLEKMSALNDDVRDFVSAVLDRSASIGVRGEFTATYLQSLGFKDVDLIGCPSMFYHGAHFPTIKAPQMLDRKARLAINVSPYLSKMTTIFEANFLRYPKSFYIPQDVDTLGLLLGRGVHNKENERHPLVNGDHPAFKTGRVKYFVDPTRWFEFLATCPFSFGSRIHGNIAALIAGTPAYVLAHDSRTLELCRYFEIPHLKLSAATDNLDPVSLLEKADYTGLMKGHKARFDAYVAFLKRNNVPHGCEDQANLADFDARLSAINFPPMVNGQRPRKPTFREKLANLIPWR
jgi:hypothetical protein